MPSSMIAPLIGAAVSGIGGLMNQPGEQSQSTSSTPWGPQGAHLESLYNKAETVMKDRSAAGPYTGPTYSPINDIQKNAATTAADFAAGTGQTLASGTGGTATTLQSGAPAFISNAATMAANGTGSTDPALAGVLSGYATGATKIGSVDPALSTALTSAATSGAGAIGNFNSGLTTAASTAMADPTESLAKSAGIYANSGYVDDAVAASNANIQHTLGITNATSDRAASNRGGINSSRAGMEIAMNEEAAARLGATTEAGLRSNAFATGLQTAAGQRTSGLQTATTANLGGLSTNGQLATAAAGLDQRGSEFDTTSRLAAATSGLAQGNTAAQLDASTKLGANAQLGTGAGLGVNAADTSLGLAGKSYDMGAAAGGLYQGDANATAADAFAKWQRDNGYQQSVVDAYGKIVTQGYNGANSSTGTGTTTAPSNMASNILGGAATGYGLYDQWQNRNGSSTPIVNTSGWVPGTPAVGGLY